MYQTIVQAVLAHAKETPDKLAIGFKKIRVTYGELGIQVRAFAQKLQQEFGIEKGDFIMISAVSKPEYIVGYLAVQYLGGVSIPIDKSAKLENILDVYEYAQPKILLADGKVLHEKIRVASLKGVYADCLEIPEEELTVGYQEHSDEELSEILFTTGTTGKPKGTMLSVANIYASTHNTWHGVGMQTDDVVLLPLPLNHSVGMRVTRTIFYIGATLILQNGFTFAQELEKNIEGFHCTGLVSVPASIELVYRQMQDKFAGIMGNLRYMEFGAGSLSYDMKKKLVNMLPNTKIVNTWGSTETGGAIFLIVSENPDKLTALGKPIEGVEVKTVDTEGNEITARDIDTAGRMVLRGKMQMMGYYQMPEANAQTLVDGWLYTNDMVYLDEDGYIYMLGRADDIINVGGEKVSPVEVENIAQEFEEIRECACIGVDDPDGILGKVPVLYIVPEGSAVNEEELTKFLAERMERYKLPQRYLNIRELPRNRMKKLDRKALYRRWEENGDQQMVNEVVQNILSRRSIRDFTEEQVPKAVLETILQCGYYAPSGHNMQTWKFTVIQNAEKIHAFRQIVEKVSKEKKVHFYGFNNPKTIVLVSNDRRNADGIQDSSCAVQNMMLAANSYGIGSAWINALMTICDEPEVREMLQGFGIPDTHIVWSTVVMGYPAKAGKELAKKTNVINWVE